MANRDRTGILSSRSDNKLEMGWAEFELFSAFDKWYQHPRMLDRELDEVTHGEAGGTWKRDVASADEALQKKLGDPATMWDWLEAMRDVGAYRDRGAVSSGV